MGQFTRVLSVLMGLLFTLMIWERKDGEISSERLGTLMLMVVGVMLVGRDPTTSRSCLPVWN